MIISQREGVTLFIEPLVSNLFLIMVKCTFCGFLKCMRVMYFRDTFEKKALKDKFFRFKVIVDLNIIKHDNKPFPCC